MNLRYTDILRYSPYDYKVDLKANGYDENFFISHFLVDKIATFKIEHDIFKNSLNRTKSSFHPYIILSGYSGCGKTTLINYLARTLSKEFQHSFSIVNLTKESEEPGREGLEVLKYSLQRELYNLLKKSLRSIILINNNISDFVGFNNVNIMQLTTDLDALIDRHSLTIENSRLEKDYLLYLRQFLSKLSVKELLVYYILDKIIDFNYVLTDKYGSDHINQKIVESLVICFDNIDEIRLQALTKEFWDELSSAIAILSNVCRNPAFELNIDLIRFMSIILTFRESNISLYNSQIKDRLHPFRLNRRIILDGEVDKILKKRIDFIENHKEEFTEDYDSHLGALIRIFGTDNKWIRKAVLPLFNFDYRKFFEFFPSLLKENSGGPENFNYNLSYKEFMNIHELNSRVARGIIYAYLIDFAFKTYFDRYRILPEDSCNKYRMLLTVMFNLAYPQGLDESLRRNRQRPRHFKLKELISKTKIFKVSDVLNMTARFFPQNEASFAQWIIIYDSDIKLLQENKYEETIKKPPSEHTDDEASLIELVENSEVYFNASAYAYLRYVVTHFEYYAYLVRKENPDVTNLPLPLLDGIDFFDNPKDEKDILSNLDSNIPCFQFETVISEVYKYVVRKKYHIEKFYSEIFLKSYRDEVVFSKSHWAFGESLEKKSFYITKVLFTHIDYIENYRYFAWYSANFNKKLDEHRNKLPALKSRSQIQDFLLEIIEKYIEQCQLIKYKNIFYGDLIEHMKNNINKIKLLKDEKTGEYQFPSKTMAETDWIWIRNRKDKELYNKFSNLLNS